jgi:hypothetical protein
MTSKKITWLFATIGLSVGSYLPILWGGSFLSYSSVLLTGVGGLVGVWIGIQVDHWVNG